jgi:hypothetical protein
MKKTVCVFFFISLGLVMILSGCTRIKVTPPQPQLFAPYPLAVTSNQLGLEYLTDPAAADAKYKDKEIWITQTIVYAYAADKENYGIITLLPTKTQIYDDSHDGILQILDLEAVDCKIISLHCPQAFSVGDMVEIVGICQGIQDSNITINISMINKIGASAVRTGTPSEGY